MNKILAPIDANFWSLDTPTTHQAIASLCLLDCLPDRARLLDDIARLLPILPLMQCRVEGLARPRWVLHEGFSLEEQVRFFFRPEISDRDSLLAAASQEFSAGVDRSGPLWRIAVISNYKSHSDPPEKPLVALLFLIHHTFADGLGGLEMFDSFCSGGRELDPTIAAARTAEAAAAKHRLEINALKSFGRLMQEWLARPGQSPLNGPNSAERKILLTDIPIEHLQASRRAFGASLNDLMLTIVAGAVHRYHHALGTPPEDLRILMPVSLRRLTERLALGNRLTGVGVRLPVSLSDPAEQLRRIREYVDRLKAEGSLGAYELMARAAAKLPHRVRLALCERAARKANFICTSVSAAMRPRYVGGARIDGNYGVAALMRGQGIAFAFTRYARTMCLSLVSDPGIVRDPQLLLGYINESGQELLNHRPAACARTL